MLVHANGSVLGCLPKVDLAQPWWQESGDLVEMLQERFGLRTAVLRLVSTSTPEFQPGADVVYAVEVLGETPTGLPLEACPDLPLGDDQDPLRMPWARVGGVAADVEWADRELRALGRRRTDRAIQVRTWNLSLLLRLQTDNGTAWLKHVPPFLRHEGAVIELVRAEGVEVPVVLAADQEHGRLLLEDVPGEDAYAVDTGLAIRMVESLVRLQRRMISGLDRIASAGAPDWGAGSLAWKLSRLAARDDVRANLDSTERQGLDRLAGELPARVDALYACGLRDTLVHGDFFPGNHRIDGDRLVLIDWGDSASGHPLFDMTAFLTRIEPEQVDPVRRAWLTAWQNAAPDANVQLAADLIRPIAALRQAAIYQGFLDGIESSERVYHRADVPRWLRRALTLSRESPREG